MRIDYISEISHAVDETECLCQSFQISKLNNSLMMEINVKQQDRHSKEIVLLSINSTSLWF